MFWKHVYTLTTCGFAKNHFFSKKFQILKENHLYYNISQNENFDPVPPPDPLIKTNNIIFTHKTLNNNSPSHFKNFYQLYSPSHDYPTINNPNSTYSIPSGSIKLLDHEAGTFKRKCAEDWNDILKKVTTPTSQDNWLLDLNVLRLKNITKTYILNTY